MVSLSPFLRGTRTPKEEVLHRALSVVLQGMGRHATRFGADEAEEFDALMHLLREDLAKTKDPDRALVIAASAVRALEEYTDASMHRYEEAARAWRDMTRVVLRFLDQSAGLPDGSGAENLLSRDLDAAVSARDIRALRSRVEECLADLAESAPEADAPVAARASAASAAEGKRLSCSIYADSAPEDTDDATGLPGPRVAMRAIEATWNQRENRYLVAFLLERLDAVNVRFGSQAGDQILQEYSQHLAQSLGPSDQVFRWRGPCLVALIERELPEGLVAAEVSRASAARLEHAITVQDRELMVPVSSAWSIVSLPEHASVEDVCRRVDEFIEERLQAYYGASAGRR